MAPALPQDSRPHPRTLYFSATVAPASTTSVQPLAHNSSCCHLCMSSHRQTSSAHLQHLPLTTSKRQQCCSRQSSAPIAWSAGTWAVAAQLAKHNTAAELQPFPPSMGPSRGCPGPNTLFPPKLQEYSVTDNAKFEPSEEDRLKKYYKGVRERKRRYSSIS